MSDPEKGPGPKPDECQEWACTEREDIRFDPVSRKWLCKGCWAKVNPIHYYPHPKQQE